MLPDGLTDYLIRVIRSRQDETEIPASYGYKILEYKSVPRRLLLGWKNKEVAVRQYRSFIPLLHQMYQGNPRADFIALSNTVQAAGMSDPLIIEVGCGSGWNSEVLSHMLKKRFRYIGLDYSFAMVSLGKQSYGDVQFVVGDVISLPLKDKSCDILISGTVLMHILNYKKAISECTRVSRHWCIFHTVPVMKNRKTTFLKKFAYGHPVVEVIFNEQEILDLFQENGLVVQLVVNSIPYDLKNILGENTFTKTYLCRVLL